ncbi:MAG: HlyD family efflux transporter periplasmic adaptor subunit [Planctomycetota bacterium]|nr:HlyD family efflux transporter periplasmic adaptor subunit [Planctomycetota bacterium]
MKTVLSSIGPVFSLLVAVAGFSQEPAESKPEATAPVTKVSGAFEAKRLVELSAATKQVKSLTIKRIVPHGVLVRKGQPVVWFETEAPEQQLSEAETNLRLAEIAMREAEFNLEQFLETLKLDKAGAELAYKHSKQDYDNFVQTDREREVLSTEFGLKSSRASLENVLEELQQLEKMYKEDELTEESEEIVLKRAKQAVENAQFRLEGSEITAKRSLAQTIPRTQAQQEDSLARQQLAFDKAIRTLEFDRQRRSIEFDKSKEKLDRQKAELQELREDRKDLVIQASEDGIIYHGQITRGRLGDNPSKLSAGSTVANQQVVVTLVPPKPLVIRLDLQEKDLGSVRVGSKGTVLPTAFPDRKLVGTIISLSYIPLANNKFDGVMSVRLENDEPAITPGMTCSVEFEAEPSE